MTIFSLPPCAGRERRGRRRRRRGSVGGAAAGKRGVAGAGSMHGSCAFVCRDVGRAADGGAAVANGSRRAGEGVRVQAGVGQGQGRPRPRTGGHYRRPPVQATPPGFPIGAGRRWPRRRSRSRRRPW
ncbi:unnamed protein product, partial [Ectocarpus sp. 13 AM-2016]